VTALELTCSFSISGAMRVAFGAIGRPDQHDLGVRQHRRNSVDRLLVIFPWR
jgi:hypothetical protein